MKIGIALAAYQPDPRFFALQLQSIVKQTYSNWICVITCDSPLQKIFEASEIKPFQNHPQLVWIENSVRLGHKKNFEKAIQETLKHSVDAIACSDQDDIWYENKLASCLDCLKPMQKKSLVHSDMHVLKNDQILPETAWKIENRGISNHLPKHFMIRNIVAGCSMIFDAELARLFPQIPAELEFHDHWYALIAAFYGGVGAVHQPLYAYRQHGQNEVGVSPFHEIFYVPPGLGKKDIIQKCIRGWKKSQGIFDAANRAHLPVTFTERLLFQFRWDFGLSLFVLGLYHLFSDPPLARACFARGAGKAFEPFFKQSETYSKSSTEKK